MGTLLVAAISSAIAATVVSRLWQAGTVMATAMTPVIASGGAGTLDHLAEALRAGADAALCASIFHYGQHTVAEAKAHLAAAGIAVRA